MTTTPIRAGLVNGFIGFPTLCLSVGVVVIHFVTVARSESPLWMLLFLGASIWSTFIFYSFYSFKLKVFKKMDRIVKKESFLKMRSKKEFVFAHIMLSGLFPIFSENEMALDKFLENLRDL